MPGHYNSSLNRPQKETHHIQQKISVTDFDFIGLSMVRSSTRSDQWNIILYMKRKNKIAPFVSNFSDIPELPSQA